MKQLSLIKNKRRRKPGPKKESSEVSHVRREIIDRRKPMHLTLRVVKGLPKLRQRRGFQIFKRAVGKASKLGLKVVHFNIENNHLHIIAEANDNQALAKGMQSFGICFAKQLKKWMNELSAKKWKSSRGRKGPREASFAFLPPKESRESRKESKISANYKKIFEGRYHLRINAVRLRN